MNCKEVILTFEEAEITLNIDPDEGENVGGWNITPLVHPVVSLYCRQNLKIFNRLKNNG